MPKLKKRLFKCRECNTVVKSKLENPKCQTCHRYSLVPIEDERRPEQESEHLPKLHLKIPLDLDMQNDIQFLMNLGVGKTPDEIIEKAVEWERLRMMKLEKERRNDPAWNRYIWAYIKKMKAEAGN